MDKERFRVICFMPSKSRDRGGQSVEGLPSPPARPHVPCQAPPGPPTSLYKVTPLKRAKREPPAGRGHGSPGSRSQTPVCGIRQGSLGEQREPVNQGRLQASEVVGQDFETRIRASEQLETVSVSAYASERVLQKSVCERRRQVLETRLQELESRLHESELEASACEQRHSPEKDVQALASRQQASEQKMSVYRDRQTAERRLQALENRLQGSELEALVCDSSHAPERGRQSAESERQEASCEKRTMCTLATMLQPAAGAPEPFEEAIGWSADETSCSSSGDESEGMEAEAPDSPDLTEERGALTGVPHRKTRIAFSSQQTSRLETTFRKQQYLSTQERRKLAASLQISERQIKNWFQNRRSKLKRQAQDHLQSPMPPTPLVQPYSYLQKPFGTHQDIMAYHYGPQHPACQAEGIKSLSNHSDEHHKMLHSANQNQQEMCT
ncbi:hypothetical protein NDU88_007835 [Pleurodeles waltl]|uniref:Homeobox domain-containing protein n=1 Tax=Pleurodeles waltl TaxID=8319 RepID=A0AAV7QQX2_PLEWA|nr:hypothetical protein NDU88_007835 [Pleurodeles waltl]